MEQWKCFLQRQFKLGKQKPAGGGKERQEPRQAGTRSRLAGRPAAGVGAQKHTQAGAGTQRTQNCCLCTLRRVYLRPLWFGGTENTRAHASLNTKVQ